MASKSKWTSIQNWAAYSETDMSHFEKAARDLRGNFATRVGLKKDTQKTMKLFPLKQGFQTVCYKNVCMNMGRASVCLNIYRSYQLREVVKMSLLQDEI